MRTGKNNLVKRWWRQLAFDLPRARTNAESRKRVVGIFLSILIALMLSIAVLIVVTAVEFRMAGRWGAPLLAGTIFVLALAAWRWLTRGRKPPVTLRLHTRRSPSVREGILRQRSILACLVDRADWEARSAMAPTKPEGGIRARLIERLRHRRLWDSVPLPLQRLLSEPEGSWHRERIRRVRLQLDAVQVLSWAVQEDYELPSLRTAAEVDPKVLHTALMHIDKDSESLFLRDWSEIEAEIAPVSLYLARLHNELVKRNIAGGTFDEAVDKRMEAYMDYSSAMGEVDVIAEDLPMGTGLVSEARSEDVIHLRAIAAVRFLTLETLRTAVESGTPVGFEEQNGWIAEKLTLHM